MKKLKNTLFWIGVFLVILTYIIVKPLSDLDEMWNFNVARCIANGLVPYKDISMVSTPLLGFISAIFLKVFGSEMFVTRILSAIIALINLGLIYKICTKAKIASTISKILILVIMYIMKYYYCLDYNIFAVTLTLFIILLELKNIEQNNKNKKIHIVIGILSGLVICTKQSVGAFVSILVVVSQLVFIKSKQSLKEVFINIIFRCIGIFIPVLIFAIYLWINGAFNYFIDYCVLGIKTFSNKISYMNLINSEELLIKVSAIAMPICLMILLLLSLILRILKKQDKVLSILVLYCLPVLIIVYPISDNIHFLIAITPIYIAIIYSISLLVKKIIKGDCKYTLEFFEIMSFTWIIFFTIFTEYEYREELGELSKYRELNHFSNIIVDAGLSDTVKEVDEYILSSEKEVYILDSNAVLYMIPLDRYNKNYDMFLKGNLGSGGEEAQIEELKNREEDVRYLILNENYSLNWQTPTEVLQYVKENYVKSGSIGIYDIYEREQIVEYDSEGEE